MLYFLIGLNKSNICRLEERLSGIDHLLDSENKILETDMNREKIVKILSDIGISICPEYNKIYRIL